MSECSKVEIAALGRTIEKLLMKFETVGVIQLDTLEAVELAYIELRPS